MKHCKPDYNEINNLPTGNLDFATIHSMKWNTHFLWNIRSFARCFFHTSSFHINISRDGDMVDQHLCKVDICILSHGFFKIEHGAQWEACNVSPVIFCRNHHHMFRVCLATCSERKQSAIYKSVWCFLGAGVPRLAIEHAKFDWVLHTQQIFP